MTLALGIDLSKWNGNWDAAKAKRAGATFVFVKASQQIADPRFAENWKAAKDAGLLRGAYHYLDYTVNELDQAKLFVSLIKNDLGELPPVWDFEQRYIGMPSAAIVRGKLWNFLQYVEKETGKVPMIYTGYYYWLEFCNSNIGWLKYPFWLAWYEPEWYIKLRTARHGGHGVPPPWKRWTFWQFEVGSNGPDFGSSGLNIDMDRFNGTIDDLHTWAKPGTAIPPVALTLEQRVARLETLHQIT